MTIEQKIAEKTQAQKTVSVIGGGAWGTALAQVLAAGGRDVLLWAREDEVVSAVNTKHENTLFLSGIPLDKSLKATNSYEEVAKRDVILLVPPAQHMRSTLESLKNIVRKETPLVICSKGIELNTGQLMTQVAQQVMPEHKFSVLTGPTFASEIAKGLPSAVTIASKTDDAGYELQSVLGVRGFRPYVTTDMIGTQLGGALKNVVAIACGIVIGRGLGESARAALLTRGLAEISRLAVAMGADKTTLLGMCGVGDLTLTCSSMQSRNYSLGIALGEGKTLEVILGTRNSVTEGVHTSKATLKLAKNYAVDMPVTEAVNKILNEGLPIEEAIEDMLNRPFKYQMSTRRPKKKAH